ncbi:MAG: HAMP domain-containing sensor histidine kinase [Microscillaceae bacterium]|nr:HAMP domain-containing sensor histidine kinase [Microscillaceae bacterium]
MNISNNRPRFNIYNNRSRFKAGFVTVALLITTISLVYTNYLVSQLAEREEKLIDLYAQALKFAVESDIDEDVLFYVQEVISANKSIPVILVQNNEIKDYLNIGIPKRASAAWKRSVLERELKTMKSQHPPIRVHYAELGVKEDIYYRDSNLLYRLRYFPIIQLSVIFIFGFLTYLAFDYSRRAEQNRVWVGLAKETAHQLGTPISSLMAWVDYLRHEPTLKDDNIVIEIEKDIRRLEMITTRFSSIGSEPTLKSEDIYFIILGITNYLRRRISTKVLIEVKNELPRGKCVMLNRHLFEWVIENICKNAVDAMSAQGEIKIRLLEAPEEGILIDIADNGKGMTKSQIKQAFKPGFTTKKRGWGLGLTLARRIVEDYHKGKLFIKESEPGKGTTFRIVLKG